MPITEIYEYKNVLVPTANRRKQTKIINKHAKEGWELVQLRLGGGWTKTTATMRRVRP